MTYDAYEKSIDSGRPIELYEFQNGSTFWRYHSGDEEIFTWSTIEFNWCNLHRSKIVQSQEGIRNQLTLEAPRDFPPGLLYKQFIPLYNTTLVIRRLHRDDPDEEVKIIWQGRIFDVTWPLGKGKMKIRLEPSIGSLKSEALRGRWQIRCNHTIYDEFCKLEFVTNSTPFTVAALSDGNYTLNLPGLGSATPTPEHWIGGLLRLGSDQFNMIAETSGDNLKVWRYMPDLEVGSSVLVAPGCQNLKSRCIDPFNNYENYLGAPDVPLKDIFQGDGLKGSL